MFDNNNKTRHSMALAALLALSGLSGAAWADAYEEAAKKWIAEEFNPSTLTPEQQLAELQWFIKAAEPFRGMDISVDGEAFVAPDHVTYRGMMLSDVPNLALAFGYTNASWTLKVDLTAERVCRLINHMKARNLDYVVPTPPDDLQTQPLLDFSSGYVQRALPTLPRQGATPPWRTYQNYVQDMFAIRFGKLEDGHVRFGTAGDQVFRKDAPLSEAAE